MNTSNYKIKIENAERLTSILAQWRHYPRLKKQCKMQVYHPQASAWKPPLPQYARSLSEYGGQ
jgi:hypothetical protein